MVQESAEAHSVPPFSGTCVLLVARCLCRRQSAGIEEIPLEKCDAAERGRAGALQVQAPAPTSRRRA